MTSYVLINIVYPIVKYSTLTIHTCIDLYKAFFPKKQYYIAIYMHSYWFPLEFPSYPEALVKRLNAHQFEYRLFEGTNGIFELRTPSERNDGWTVDRVLYAELTCNGVATDCTSSLHQFAGKTYINDVPIELLEFLSKVENDDDYVFVPTTLNVTLDDLNTYRLQESV